MIVLTIISRTEIIKKIKGNDFILIRLSFKLQAITKNARSGSCKRNLTPGKISILKEIGIVSSSRSKILYAIYNLIV